MNSSNQLHRRSQPAPVKVLRQMTILGSMLFLVAVGGLILLTDLLELGLDDLDDLCVIWVWLGNVDVQ